MYARVVQADYSSPFKISKKMFKKRKNSVVLCTGKMVSCCNSYEVSGLLTAGMKSEFSGNFAFLAKIRLFLEAIIGVKTVFRHPESYCSFSVD